MPLSHESLTAALFTYWRDHLAVPVPTVYPGTMLDTSAAAEWFEVWADSWPRRPQRATARQLVDLIFTIHIFTKPALPPARIQHLADTARAIASQQRIAVPDLQSSGQPLLGYITLFETETRDFSRAHRNMGDHNLRHLVLTTPGQAEAV
jgi:hypothetical protein